MGKLSGRPWADITLLRVATESMSSSAGMLYECQAMPCVTTFRRFASAKYLLRKVIASAAVPAMGGFSSRAVDDSACRTCCVASARADSCSGEPL